ncbi:MAG: hypothetical protein IT337_17615 [Thermomicrobiales bacterium]|nr:hypothetical protein [Thermomicrobiales bacterium]
MSTGATREQIEKAIERWRSAHEYPRDNPTMAHIAVTMAARHLVPPGSAIIGPDVLSAIAAVVQRERVDRALIGPSLSDEQLAALEAVLTPELRDQVEMWVREQL